MTHSQQPPPPPAAPGNSRANCAGGQAGSVSAAPGAGRAPLPCPGAGRPGPARRKPASGRSVVATRGRGACAVPSRARGWRALPAAAGHPPGTAHSSRGTLASLGARRPRRGGGDAEGRRAVRAEAGEPPGRTSPGESNSLQRKVVPGVRMAGSQGAFGWRVQGRTATHGRPPSPELRVSLLTAPPRPHLHLLLEQVPP